MSDVIIEGTNVAHDTAHGEHHGHEHHEQHFITKYIFSQDHKIIGKQFFDYRYLLGCCWCIDVSVLPLTAGFPRRDFPYNGEVLG